MSHDLPTTTPHLSEAQKAGILDRDYHAFKDFFGLLWLAQPKRELKITEEPNFDSGRITCYSRRNSRNPLFSLEPRPGDYCYHYTVSGDETGPDITRVISTS